LKDEVKTEYNIVDAFLVIYEERIMKPIEIVPRRRTGDEEE
jgi:hypothetical protein